MKKDQVTIYRSGEMFGSIFKTEGTLIECGLQKYAQYDAAPFVKFIPKGKRTGRGFVQGYKPYVVILKGVNHPEPQGMFKTIRETDEVTVRQSIYSSFDDRWKTDFDEVLNAYLEKNPDCVIMDVRHTQDTNVIPQTV